MQQGCGWPRYMELKRRGQLLTFAEELEDLGLPTGQQLQRVLGAQGTLGSLQSTDAAAQAPLAPRASWTEGKAGEGMRRTVLRPDSRQTLFSSTC